MKVYIDVSNLMHVSFISGIQRVVREVVAGLTADPALELVLLEYEKAEDVFCILSLSAFLTYYRDGAGVKEEIRTGERIATREFPHGSIFLELDSVWHSRCNRMTLFPELKARGVKIAVCFQDLIPIMWPEYAAAETICSFLGYMTACVTYGDLFISSTQTNIDYLKNFMDQIGVKNPAPCAVSWLGADFRGQRQYKHRKKLEEIAAGGKYLLMVGTVEPRKNHGLVLDAMDQKLFSEGWQLVIAGRQGWNVQETAERIRNHARLGRELHWIEDASDGDVEFLYEHCRFVVFPSFTEGFGLPVVEAFVRGIPVLSAEHPVLREVGGSYCRYFSADACASLIHVLQEADKEPAYRQMKEMLRGYSAVSWQQVAACIGTALKGLHRTDNPDISAAAGVKQMVMLSARTEDFLRSLPFIEHFMPFIKEVVLCCPDAMEAEVRKGYRGKLVIRYLTDSALLEGEELPADHAARNIFLRTKAIRHDAIDDFFIMSDDDYRPLQEITEEVFYKGGRFQAYYLGDLREWKGTQGIPTSFDISMWKCRDFMLECGYSTYMFDSHMPQLISRTLFLEMLEQYPQIAKGAASEWSGYFNYLVSEYPELVEICPYVTMNWPGFLEDWNVRVRRPEYLFENFYDVVYEEGEVYRGKGRFVGFSREYHSGISEENRRKTEICRKEEQHHERGTEFFRSWGQGCVKRCGMSPVFAICQGEKGLALRMPSSMPMLKADFLRMDFRVLLKADSRRDQQWQLSWTVRDAKDRLVSVGSSRFRGIDDSVQVLLMAPEVPGSYQTEWNLYTGAGSVRRQMELEVKE